MAGEISYFQGLCAYSLFVIAMMPLQKQNPLAYIHREYSKEKT